MSISGQVALVTGAGRGIGRAIALRLAHAGVRVVLAARSEQELAATEKEILAAGGQALSLPTDVTDPLSVNRLLVKMEEGWGPPDILINNAGIAIFADIQSCSPQDWARMYEVNVLGVLRLVQGILPSMLSRGRGRIVMIASTASHKAYRNQGGYCASKHALLGFCRVLLEELRGTDIRVNVISPGGVDTLLARSTRSDQVSDEYMSPYEVAEAVHFVLTSEGIGTIDEIVIRRQKAAPAL